MGMFYMTQGIELGLCNNLEGWNGEGGGMEVQEEGDICIPIALISHTSKVMLKIL